MVDTKKSEDVEMADASADAKPAAADKKKASAGKKAPPAPRFEIKKW